MPRIANVQTKARRWFDQHINEFAGKNVTSADVVDRMMQDPEFKEAPRAQVSSALTSELSDRSNNRKKGHARFTETPVQKRVIDLGQKRHGRKVYHVMEPLPGLFD